LLPGEAVFLAFAKTAMKMISRSDAALSKE